MACAVCTRQLRRGLAAVALALWGASHPLAQAAAQRPEAGVTVMPFVRP